MYVCSGADIKTYWRPVSRHYWVCKLFFFLFISFDEFFSWEQFHGKISFHSHFLAYTFTDNNILAFFWRLYQSQMATTEKN